MDGQLDLTFTYKNNKTIIKDVFQKAPLKASRGLYVQDDSRLSMYIMESSGGLVAGDSNKLSFTLEEGSDVMIHPQSATKVYPTLYDETSRQSIEISLAKNTNLTWQREEVIPFEGAIFDSHTVINMDSTASLWWEEILYPGREKRGEFFTFKKYQTLFEVWRGDDCLVYDPLIFRPADQTLTAIAVMENYHFLASLWIVFPDSSFSVTSLQEKLTELEDHQVSITQICENGFLIRWLSNHLAQIKKDMDQLKEALAPR
ncbi:urease accessory protein [Gracilibacillus oryzae]|uniref:Urease accessory protein UreD n=2 Tax=Gracilibacillus oryzae TaxID=1672701 RepID=A0A7C8GRV1_9BACI|nr:urease accessory protein [Gracilibacillus oryzae]